MKKLNLLKSFMLLCMLFVGMGAWAESKTITPSAVSGDVVADIISFTTAKNDGTSNPAFSSNAIRLYQNASANVSTGVRGGSIIFTAAEGYVINKVTVANQNSTDCDGGTVAYQVDGTGSWLGSATVAKGTNYSTGTALGASTVEIACFGTTNKKRLYITSITVEYASTSAPTLTSLAVSGTPTKTTYWAGEAFDPAGLTVTGTYSDDNQQTISSGIEWTVTPSTPLTAGTTSVSVVASVGNVHSASYTVNSLTVNAIPEKTIAEFIAAEGGKCYLTGTVSNIKNTTYGNFDLTDESGTIYVYGCLTPAGVAQQFSTLGVVAGDKIKVLANEYELYNETEEAKNVIFVEEIEVPKAHYAVTIVAPENGTLVVKEGETVLTSGDEVEEGKTLTVECTPEAGYRYQNWQYKEAGNWITMTSTMTRTVTQAISIRANFELIPVYTVAWSVNGSVVKSEDLLEGATVTAPAVEDINDKVFVGWATTSSVDADDPEMVTPMTTATAAATYYAVFATLEDEGEITYTKVTNNTFDTSAEYVLAAEESSTSSTLHYFSSYTGTTANESWGVTSTDVDDAIVFTLSGTANALVAEDASGNYLQALATGKFRMSSTSTTLTYKTDGTIYNPSSSSYNLRYNHNNGSGGFRWYNGTTGTSAYFYKKEGGTTYSGYTTTVAAPVAKTIDFYAAGEDGYYTTFSNDKAVSFPDMIEVDGEYAQFTVYSVYAVGDMLELQDLKTTLHSDDTWYLSENEGYLIKAEYSGDVTYTGAKAFSVEYTELNYDLNSNDAENFLRPASEAKTGDSKYYMLAYSDNNCTPASLGFYWGAANGAAFDSRPNSAYLALPKDTQAKGFRFSDAETNGIKNVESTISNNAAYNLNGQRVNANAKGIVIVNGKKVLNK